MTQRATYPVTSSPSSPAKPLALVVFLENVGYITGVDLPRWAMAVIDWVTEEYAKLILHLYGAHRRYDRVIVLEDERATGAQMVETLITTSRTHTVDLLLLVHGQERRLVGYRGKTYVDDAVFGPLLKRYREDPSRLDLRMVYGVNCYGATLAPVWLALGAQAVNGAWGVNWLPEPSLSLFLRSWLHGAPYSEAVARSFHGARRIGRLLWRDRPDGREHPHIAGSHQIVYGQRDVTLDG